jgi:phosphodiesterase/alkaline phosphatase D-like protein
MEFDRRTLLMGATVVAGTMALPAAARASAAANAYFTGYESMTTGFGIAGPTSIRSIRSGVVRWSSTSVRSLRALW